VKQRECPVCGSAVRPENLRAHIARVHPRAEVKADLPKPAAKATKPVRRLSQRRRETWAYVLFTVIVVLVVIVALLPRGPTVAPPFSLTDVDGAPVALEDYRGEVLFLDLMSTSCSVCQSYTNGTLKTTYSTYLSKVQFLSVDINRERDNVLDGNFRIRAFMQTYGTTWQYALDTDGVADKYGVTGTPTTVIVDRDGKIAYRHVGYETVDEIAGQINRLVT